MRSFSMVPLTFIWHNTVTRYTQWIAPSDIRRVYEEQGQTYVVMKGERGSNLSHRVEESVQDVLHNIDVANGRITA